MHTNKIKLKEELGDPNVLLNKVNKQHVIKVGVQKKIKEISLSLISKQKDTIILIDKEPVVSFYSIDNNWENKITISLPKTDNELGNYFYIYGDVVGMDIFCYDIAITEIDISKNQILEELLCPGSGPISIDVSKNKNLKNLNCSSNWMIDLDVSKNENLIFLNCEGNNIDKLDVTNCKNLRGLYCSMNEIKRLDLTNNTELEDLYIGDNQISKINLSKNTKLKRLACPYNNISKLDLSNNKEISTVDCVINDMSEKEMKFLIDTLPEKSIIDKGEIIVTSDEDPKTNQQLKELKSISESKNWEITFEEDYSDDDDLFVITGYLYKRTL